MAGMVAQPAFSEVLKVDLPLETVSYKPAAGLEFVNGQCLVCHSVDYVVMQPPLSRTVWTAEVKKMREKYGATIPDDQVEPIINYLATNYGTETNAMMAASTNAVAGAATAESVVNRYGCLGCHDPTAKKIGPTYKDVATKYKSDPKAEERIAEQIHKGGSGKWGPVLMPPFPMVSDAETRAVTAWILKLK